MKRAFILAAGLLVCAAPMAMTPAPLHAQSSAQAYKAPRNALGQPDLGGYWTNATLTPEMRPASFGERLVFTPEEVREREVGAAEEFARGSEATDPNAPAPKVGGEIAEGVRPEFAAAGGGVGGYNIGWLDPGNTIMRVRGEPRTSLITTKTGRPPARKEGAPAAFAPRRPGAGGAFDNPESRSLGERCIMSFGRNAGPPMMPNGFYNNNYQIVQSKEAVAIGVEMVHDTRIVRLNSQHRTDGVRPWMGDSIGWFEGDTLVVETTNLPQSMQYQGAWENLKVTERFTRVAPDRLHYKFTVEDPSVWDEPWGGEYEFAALDGRVMEYACHEGNYALEGILAGAREQEREAASRADGPLAAAPAVR